MQPGFDGFDGLWQKFNNGQVYNTIYNSYSENNIISQVEEIFEEILKLWCVFREIVEKSSFIRYY